MSLGMHDYGPSTYGDHIADVYDAWFHPPSDPAAAIDFLAELVGSGPALELAIGTGRIALPLATRGVEIQGIDASAAMVAKLREKPGGTDIPVTMGDFADVPVEGRFQLVFVVFNTLFALLTQDDQRRCPPGGGRPRDPRGIAARCREPAGELSAGRARGDRITDIPRRAPIRLALRARSHGRAGRASASGTMGRLEPRAVHRRREARLGVRTFPVLAGLLEHRHAARSAQEPTAFHRSPAPHTGSGLELRPPDRVGHGSPLGAALVLQLDQVGQDRPGGQLVEVDRMVAVDRRDDLLRRRQPGRERGEYLLLPGRPMLQVFLQLPRAIEHGGAVARVDHARGQVHHPPE